MNEIKVVVTGAMGRMGQEVVKAVCNEAGMQVVGATELEPAQNTLSLPDNSGEVPLAADISRIFNDCRPEVVVDFTIPKASMPLIRLAAERGINLVIGTTGFKAEDINEIERLAQAGKIGVVIAPNFALGAVLMIHLAKIAARHLDYVEITELHHHLKADAPSGTALNTAKAMVTARGKPFRSPEQAKNAASRGESIDGIAIHSVRLPGLMAHQEIMMGAPGQTLSIRHDTINRECYMPGVILAVKEVVKRQGLIYGLDALLGL
jgi:4-hydroxy-tetrahydrodipicolinate reductase